MLATAREAIGEVRNTLRHIRAYRTLAFFLLGFLFYNDGIQTVLSQASTFAIDELQMGTEELTQLILMIQFVAFPGAMAVGWLARRIGRKTTLMLCLACWVVLLVDAYFVRTRTHFWGLGFFLALVMGGTQSVSRAIMGVMTPAKHTAEFFGFFNFSGKATSFLGTFTFGAILHAYGSARMAIVSLLIFFLIGWAVAATVDVNRGRREAMAR